ncbi:methyltransferase domain-containing protein [Sodiomyces alkalinus F11]|uniref:type I protein arginine methyltransferase n=1 Tax=Sodiomyces alkalinus (strain CBS 110278 / VKM F-3762 / F11) TaxID=1314773 RepID=A0A3N2Q9B6_SODAK|nr:methyltransferase domain-containing protein [Sodiomyces alkalinus F11]ROT43354.1 methyltransferase domain-containing protein [Sodiomyces alkalinus F11]
MGNRPINDKDPDFSDDSASSGGDEAEWLDVESEEDEPLAVISLLDDSVFPDVMSMLKYCKENHGFDFLAVRQRLGLDFHGTVKLVNFIRQQIHDGCPLPETITAETIKDDRYLKPVVDDDALILSLDELDIDALDNEAASSAAENISSQDLVALNSRLEEELAAVKSQFANYRLAVEQTLERRWGDDKDVESSTKDESQYYWESYGANDIHETMLKDTVRTDAYRDFIYENKALFKDKVVLDIGCGTGILSMFCARAGAKAVFAVDKAEVVEKARANIFTNGLSDTITCIKGRIEDIELPVPQVDIIVSEWMGYCLLYEAMLPSVLYARDRYLKPDGLLVPSFATIWVAPVSDPEYMTDHVSFWDDVYGFDMKAMKTGIYEEARVEDLPPSTICGQPSQISHLDLHSVKPEQLNFRSDWKSDVNQSVESIDGFLIWFDIFFTTSRQETVPPRTGVDPSSPAGRIPSAVAFTTGPRGPVTHWKQGLLLVDRTKGIFTAEPGTGISGEVVFQAPEDNPRALGISMSWVTKDSEPRSQTWKLR